MKSTSNYNPFVVRLTTIVHKSIRCVAPLFKSCLVAAVAASIGVTPLKVWADEASELQDLIDLTFQELNETFAETQDLEDIAADAEPYGEELYQGFEDGTWLTGNEIVDISENGIEERLEQIENLMEQLEDLLEQQYEENGPTYT